MSRSGRAQKKQGQLEYCEPMTVDALAAYLQDLSRRGYGDHPVMVFDADSRQHEQAVSLVFGSMREVYLFSIPSPGKENNAK